MFLDFYKAFDSIEHNFLFAALDKFGLGNSFIQWVKTIHNNSNSSIINNGWISSHFKIERGVRQGCLLSTLLIVVEILAQVIRNDPEITGFKVRQKQIKITQLADDTQIYISKDRDRQA